MAKKALNTCMQFKTQACSKRARYFKNKGEATIVLISKNINVHVSAPNLPTQSTAFFLWDLKSVYRKLQFCLRAQVYWSVS